jgi:hypothetical protein
MVFHEVAGRPYADLKKLIVLIEWSFVQEK